MEGKTQIRQYFSQLPILYERPEITTCPVCGQRLKVYKTKNRTLIRLRSGKVIIRRTYLYCEHGHPRIIIKPIKIHEYAPEYATLGLEVTVRIGLSRFLKGMKIKAIREELERQGISVCKSTVVNQCIRFLAYFLCIHTQSIDQLKELFKGNGGYILHFDSTSEGESQKLILFIDGITGIVIDVINSIAADYEHYRLIMETIKHHFDLPLELVSDLGKAEIKSAKKVFPGVLHLYCHYHFLRAVGNKLLKKDYDRFRTLIKAKLEKLNDSKKKVIVAIEECTNSFQTGLENDALLEVFHMIDYLLRYKECGSGLGRPFDLSYVYFYDRCLKVSDMIRTSIKMNSRLNKLNRVLNRLETLLQSILLDPELRQLYNRLKAINHAFLELRGLFHLEPEHIPLSDKHEVRWHDFQKLRMAAMRFIRRLRGLLQHVSADQKTVYETIISYLRTYWSHLFYVGKLTRDFSNREAPSREILTPRTNNIAEQKNRLVKHRIRCILGKRQIGKELDSLGKGVALVSNLDNDAYVKAVYDSLDGILDRFRSVPFSQVSLIEKELLAELRGIRKYRVRGKSFHQTIANLMKRKQQELEALDCGSQPEINKHTVPESHVLYPCSC